MQPVPAISNQTSLASVRAFTYILFIVCRSRAPQLPLLRSLYMPSPDERDV